MMEHRILIAGCIGFGNAGDEAIAQAVTDDLRLAIPAADITIVSGDPARTAEAYGVHAIDWHNPAAFLDAVRAADLTIVGGGGLFEDYWAFDPQAVLTRHHWGLSYYVTPALLSAVFGKPLMLYAVGVGPLTTGPGRKFTRAAAGIASRITVRDPGSARLLESIGVRADKIEVTADPAFGLQPPAASSNALAIPEVRRWISGRPAVAVCLRSWAFGKEPMFGPEIAVDPDQALAESRIAAAIDDLLANDGAQVLFVPFHLSPGSHDDLVVAQRVHALLRHRQNAAVLTTPCAPLELAAVLAQADLVAGMRLHSIILSLAAQVPFVALEYDPKVGAAADLAGFQEFVLPFGIEAAALAAKMRQALTQRECLRELEGRLIDDLRVRARRNARVAAELLSAGSCPADYGPDARDLIGDLLQSRVSEAETRLRELEETRTQLDAAWKESARRLEELHSTRHEAETVREGLAAESRRSGQLALDLERSAAARQDAESRAEALERQLAGHESKSLGAMAKRIARKLKA